MVVVKKRIKTLEEVKKEEQNRGKDWGYPGHAREFLIVNIPGNTAKEREEMLDDKRNEMKERGYEELSFKDAVRLFGTKAQSRSAEYSSKKILFFLWQYSQLFKKIEENYEDVLGKISESDALKVMEYVRESGIIDEARFSTDFGFELSRKGELVVRDKMGKPIFVAGRTGTHPKRDSVRIYDLSLRTIKKAMEDLNLKFPKLDKTTKKS